MLEENRKEFRNYSFSVVVDASCWKMEKRKKQKPPEVSGLEDFHKFCNATRGLAWIEKVNQKKLHMPTVAFVYTTTGWYQKSTTPGVVNFWWYSWILSLIRVLNGKTESRPIKCRTTGPLFQLGYRATQLSSVGGGEPNTLLPLPNS